MNICVITPLYPVKGRNDIKNDTQAIHLLLKYLAKEHNIHVFNINRISSRDLLTNFAKKGNNLNSQYNYSIDNVEVTLLRYMAYPKAKIFDKEADKYCSGNDRKCFGRKNFIPDVIAVHFPASFPNLLDGMYQGVRKVAVLHRTDINIIRIVPTLIENINMQYRVVVARSKSVSDMARVLGRSARLCIAYSGIPREFLLKDYEHSFNNLSHELSILYVGKLIERKHPNICYCCVRSLMQKVYLPL